MKKWILAVMAAVVAAGLFIKLAPAVFNNTGPGWVNGASVTVGRGFYFGKRQWLADIRTVLAAIRYLHQSRTAGPTAEADVADNPHSPPVRPAVSTNLFGERRHRIVAVVHRQRAVEGRASRWP